MNEAERAKREAKFYRACWTDAWGALEELHNAMCDIPGPETASFTDGEERVAMALHRARYEINRTSLPPKIEEEK